MESIKIFFQKQNFLIRKNSNFILQQIQNSIYYTSVPVQKVLVHYLPGFGLIYFMDNIISWSMLSSYELKSNRGS